MTVRILLAGALFVLPMSGVLTSFPVLAGENTQISEGLVFTLGLTARPFMQQ